MKHTFISFELNCDTCMIMILILFLSYNEQVLATNDVLEIYFTTVSVLLKPLKNVVTPVINKSYNKAWILEPF